MYRYIHGISTIPEAKQIAGQYVTKGVYVTTYGAGLVKTGQYLWNANQSQFRKIIRMTADGFEIDSAFNTDVVVAEDIYTISMTEVNATIYNNGNGDAYIDTTGQKLPAYAPTILNLTLTSPLLVDASGTELLVTETEL